MVEFQKKERYGVEDLRRIMRMLRGEGGCPWDREQTHESIRKNLIEETYEVVEAIDLGDASMLREELGDVLLQVVFHTQMEEEKNGFTFDDVTTDICQKLIERHPHIFGDVTVSGVSDVLDNWNAIKRQTKGQTTAAETLAAVPKQLPALMRAEKLLGRAQKANRYFGGADVSDAVMDLQAEMAELDEALEADGQVAVGAELGDVLFAAVNVARHCGVDPEEMLSRACERFLSRFGEAERLAGGTDDFCTAEEETLQVLWESAKKKQE